MSAIYLKLFLKSFDSSFEKHLFKLSKLIIEFWFTKTSIFVILVSFSVLFAPLATKTIVYISAFSWAIPLGFITLYPESDKTVLA